MFFGFLLLWGLSSAAQRSSPIQIPMGIEKVTLSLGNESQRINAQLSTLFSELVLIDVHCGMQISECPKYCDEYRFAEMYCRLMCQLNTGHSTNLICATEQNPVYDSTDKEISVEWRMRLPGMRTLSGFQLDETIQLNAAIGEKSKRKFEISFISATLFDRRLLGSADAVFGLKPGLNSIVEQIFREFGIKRKILTVANILPIYSLRSPPLDSSGMLMIGGDDPVRCATWSWVPALNNESWAFVADVDFLGAKFSNIEIIINFDDGFTILPTATINRLVELRLLRANQLYHQMRTYFLSRSPKNSVKFFNRDGSAFLNLSDKTLLFNEAKMGKGISAFVNDPMDPHSIQRGDREVWTMGMAFLDEYCIGLDYQLHRVGFARRRRWPAFPFLYEGMANFEKRVPAKRRS